MDDSDNPYLPPSSDEPIRDAISSDWDENADPRTIGKARHVPTVAILMIVHGVLMLMAACGLIIMMVIMMPQMTQEIEKQQQIKRQQNPNGVHLSKEAMTTILSTVYGGVSALLFVIGVLNIYAGARNFGYHNRILGIVSLIFSLGSLFSVWCLPLSIGLLIYGMIIYLSPEADRAFRWRSGSRERTTPTR